METWPSNHYGATTTVGSHDHSGRGRDEQIMFVNRKLECVRWNFPEQRGQHMTARARDLAACSIKKPVVEEQIGTEHPCLLP